VKRLLIGFAIGLLLAAPVGAATLKFDPARSTIGFKLRHLLGTAAGRFTQFAGTIEVDPDRPESSAVQATIQARSIDTRIETRDAHLRELFEVERFPAITFRSKSVQRVDAKTADVSGDFTMHGVTKPVTLRVKLISVEGAPGRRTARWRVTCAPLKRSEFGLRWSRTVEATSMIADDVSVEMEIVASERPGG
jgi:polyisoprenoid-binding protein YceI